MEQTSTQMMLTSEEMIKELDSALLFRDVQNLMKQYARSALLECVNIVLKEVHNTTDRKNASFKILSLMSELK